MDGDEGADIASSHTRMLTVVLSHINEFLGDLASVEGTLHDGIGRTNEGVDGSVGGLASINIKKGTTS